MNQYAIIREKVKGHLLDYLQEMDPQGMLDNPSDLTFRCMNPEHEDKNPSMFVSKVSDTFNKIGHCRSCGYSVTIFHAFHFLEGAPLRGRAFIEENLNKLAVRYGYDPVDLRELTEDELAEIRLYDIYEAAFDIISNASDESTLVSREYAIKLGITKGVAKEFGIGTIVDYPRFVSMLQQLGEWSEEEIYDAGIKPSLFLDHGLSYTIHNQYGKPVAFACRDFKFDGRFEFPKEPQIVYSNGAIKTRPKWTNSERSVIYMKSDTLYGFHAVKRLQAESKVYIVEGYADAAVMWSYGIRNTVCIGSVGITPKHIMTLKEADFQFIVMAFDNDDAGLNAVDKILKDGFSTIPYVTPQVLITPKSTREDGKEDQDPDTYIKNFGADAFLRLPTMSAFQHELKRLPELVDDAEKQAFVDKFLPLLVNEPNTLTQSTMRRALADKVGVNEAAIRESQRNWEKKYDFENRQRLLREFSKMRRPFEEALEMNPDNAMMQIQQYTDLVDNTFNSSKMVKMSMHEVSDRLTTWETDLMDGSKDPTWRTGWAWWDDMFYGIPKKGRLIGFPGQAHHGKSVILMNLIVQLLEHNGDDDLMCIYWTIDDDADQLLIKLTAILSGLKINQVSRLPKQPEKIQKQAQAAIFRLKKWVREGKLCIKDSDIGTSVEDLKHQLDYVQERYPDKQPLLFIDNFGDISTGGRDKWAAQEYNLEEICRIKKSMTVISSFELNKEGFKDDGAAVKQGSMKGVSDLLYKIDLQLFLMNPMQAQQTASQKTETYNQVSWKDDWGKMRPIIELHVKKAKIDSEERFYGIIYFRLNENVGKLDMIGHDVKWEQFRKENMSGKWGGNQLHGWESGLALPATSAPPPATVTLSANTLTSKEEDDNGAIVSEQDISPPVPMTEDDQAGKEQVGSGLISLPSF